MEPKEIKKVLESGAGKAMKQYLQMRLDSLRSIEFLDTSKSNEEVGENAKAQKLAHLVLQRILDDIMVTEQTETEPEAKDSFAPGVE